MKSMPQPTDSPPPEPPKQAGAVYYGPVTAPSTCPKCSTTFVADDGRFLFGVGNDAGRYCPPCEKEDLGDDLVLLLDDIALVDAALHLLPKEDVPHALDLLDTVMQMVTESVLERFGLTARQAARNDWPPVAQPGSGVTGGRR